jgi:hypothetical protein
MTREKKLSTAITLTKPRERTNYGIGKGVKEKEHLKAWK